MKKLYIVTNHDNDYSKAVWMTEEQAKAVNWFIELADLDYSCLEPDVCGYSEDLTSEES